MTPNNSLTLIFNIHTVMVTEMISRRVTARYSFVLRRCKKATS